MSSWNEPRVIANLDSGRENFRVGSRVVVQSVFEQYLGTDAKILEIGSGLGELVSLVPEYEGNIQESEQGERNVDENKRRNPRSNVVQASAYDLPFSDCSYDAVVGYASFDTFVDIDGAMKEADRVLRPNGYFIHFLDLAPSPAGLIEQYKREGKYLFPKPEEPLEALDLVTQEEYERAIKTTDRRTRHLLETYLEMPGQYIRLLNNFNNPELYRGIVMIGDAVRVLPAPKRRVSVTEGFREQINRAVARAGLQEKKEQFRVGEFVVGGRISEINYTHQALGKRILAYLPQVEAAYGSNAVYFISELHVVVAQKNSK